MGTVISTLAIDDLDAVDRLMKQNSATLGFLPKVALYDYISNGSVLGAHNDRGELLGYLLYGVNRSYYRIAHLCVAETSRGQGIGKALVEELRCNATTQKTIKLHCRRDFPANSLWPKLGFIPLGERTGRSRAGHLLTHWCLTVEHEDQLSLFEADSGVDTLDVVIDAQIFFDLISADRNQEELSKALLSDFLAETISLRVTDELMVEIDRSRDSAQREVARNSALNFPTVVHGIESSQAFEQTLKEVLPSDTPRALSDVRQLAKTAASSVGYFVTRDGRLLRKAKEISDLTELIVLSPSELIVRVHEFLDDTAYLPEVVSGFDFRWRRLGSDDLNSLPYETFLVQGEGKGEFKGRLERYLVEPRRFDCELLWLGDEAIALRVIERNDGDPVATIHVARGSNSDKRSLIEQFMLSDSVIRSVTIGTEKVEFTDTGVFPRLMLELERMGFIATENKFIRLSFSESLRREEALSRTFEVAPEVSSVFHSMSDVDLERHCSPLAVASCEDSFLIPIRPGFALSLVDHRQAANDLFGGNANILLRWDNVYYRRRTHHRMLRPPARLLWYVSGNQGQVVAISQLDDVETDTARNLFRRYRGLGILDWNQIYDMCDGDPDIDIMALKFSHTFPFRQPISLERLRSIFEEDGVNLVLQSPSRVPPSTFRRLFQFGFSW